MPGSRCHSQPLCPLRGSWVRAPVHPGAPGVDWGGGKWEGGTWPRGPCSEAGGGGRGRRPGAHPLTGGAVPAGAGEDGRGRRPAPSPGGRGRHGCRAQRRGRPRCRLGGARRGFVRQRSGAGGASETDPQGVHLGAAPDQGERPPGRGGAGRGGEAPGARGAEGRGRGADGRSWKGFLLAPEVGCFAEPGAEMQGTELRLSRAWEKAEALLRVPSRELKCFLVCPPCLAKVW